MTILCLIGSVAKSSMRTVRGWNVRSFMGRARGDAQDESDYDIAVFLHEVADRANELNRLADLGTDILYEAGRLVHARPYRAGAYRDRTPLMHEIRTDGIDI
jgi:hypothetical protein